MSSEEGVKDMATDVREARRRKILDRGSDRLALITGRLQPLPSSSQDENATSLGLDPPSQVVIPSDPDLQPHVSNQTTAPLHGDDEALGSLLLKRDSITNVSEINAYDGGSNITPSTHQCETSIEAVRAASPEVSGKEVHSPMVSPVDQNSSASTLSLEQRLEHQTQRHRFFTPNQISSAITASENTRLLCSVTIALLVVLSHQGFPLLGSYIIKTIISFRPLYLLLLTNVTVVLARLLFDKQKGFERAAQDENETSSPNGFGWAEQVSRSLETGLVMQKALNAVFVDCSVYAIVVICGLSLAQLISWVYDDEEEWFRSIFASSKKEDAIQNQYEFFVQRMGGPPLYSQRKGHPALIARHRPFPVTHRAAERWLHHMQQALESTPDIDADSKLIMLNFFRHTAFFLVAGDQLKCQNQPPSCKHGSSNQLPSKTS